MRNGFGLPLSLLALMLTACGGSPSATDKLASIIDQDSLVAVGDGSELPLPSLRQQLGAIGRMTGGCTAFHLGEGLVATAGHCFPAPTQELSAQSCASTSIQWTQSSTSSRCLEILAYSNTPQADYALIAVDPAPQQALGEPAVELVAPAERQALVLGYPKDRELSRSAVCRAHRTAGAGSQIFYHDCDTLPGNSGSPVFDISTESLLGVHNGDANPENYGSLLPDAATRAELLSAYRARSAQQAWPLQFGPFPNKEARVLARIGSEQGKRASFTVDADLEAPYDKLIITDGRGRRTELTGLKSQSLDLPTPLVIEVQTDYSGISQLAKLSQLSLY